MSLINFNRLDIIPIHRAVPDTYTVHQTQLALIFLTADQNQKQYSTVWYFSDIDYGEIKKNRVITMVKDNLILGWSERTTRVYLGITRSFPSVQIIPEKL